MNGPLPPFQSGQTPANTGRYTNPDRPGLSWDFTFNAGTLTTLWYGFEPTNGAPVWYLSNTLTYDSQTWPASSVGTQAPLYRMVQTAAGQSQIAEIVGSVAVSFVQGQPEHLAVSWKLNSMAQPIIECVQRLGSDAVPNRSIIEQVGPAYTGLWYAPASSGWGYQALIDSRVETRAGVEVQTFRESNIISIYDTNNRPVWFAADSLAANGLWSTAPPPLALLEMPLKYLRANYDVTAQQVTCASNCVSEVVASAGATAKFWRSYLNSGAGTIGVDVNASYVNGTNTRTVNFTRPPGVPNTVFVSQKLTQASNIIASPTNCLAFNSQASTCPVAVTWAVLQTGIYGWPGALPYVRDLDTGAQTLLSSDSSGNLIYQLRVLPTPQRVQFSLKDPNTPFDIARSSEIRALSPRLDDPAFSTLLPYQPQTQSTYAGTGSGSGGTSGGQASYSIPVQIAPGRHGMQPSVSLNYSSSAGNGIAGMGWNMSASASIHRCPQTRAQDGQSNAVTFSMTDRLCLDGQRLIPLQSGATYGSANTEYRTEQDSQTKVLQLGGDLTAAATYFVVYRSNGMVEHFGASRNPSGLLVADAASQQIQTGNTKALAWMLRRSLDRSGNAVLYSYQSYGSAELLLKQILYTGTEQTPGDRSVNFDYTARPDLSSSGLGGFLMRQTQVLNWVESRVGGQLVRRYKLQYGSDPNVIGVSKSSGRAQLTQVTECADESGAEKYFVPIALAWQDTPSVGPNLSEASIIWPAGMPTPSQPIGEQPRLVDEFSPIGDIDGDGVSELSRVLFDGSMTLGLPRLRSFIVSFKADRTAKGYIETGVPGFIAGFQGGNARQTQDINNDGLVEAWGVVDLSNSGAKLQFQFWDASLQNPTWAQNFRTVTTAEICSLKITPPGSISTNSQLIDVNADGLPDLVAFSSGACGLGRGIYVHLNQSVANGNQAALTPVFSSAPVYSPLLGSDLQNVLYFSDLSGDGMPELVTSVNAAVGSAAIQNFVYSFARNGASVSIVTRNTFGEALVSGISDPHVPWNSRRFSFSDINGDGLDDVIFANKTTGGPCDSRWAVRLNLGGKFGALINVGGANQAGLEMSQISGACRPVARDWEPQHATLVSYEDTDGDGRAEIIVPRGLRETILTEVIFPDGKNQSLS